MAGLLTVYGFKQFVVGSEVALLLDGIQAASVTKNKSVDIPITKDCVLSFRCGFTTSKEVLHVEDGMHTTVQLEYNRLSGKISGKVLEKAYFGERNAVDEVEKAILEFDGGVGDILTVYEDRIVIKHKGALNFFAMGAQGDKTIYFSDITGIQFKPAGALTGYLQFSILGGVESKGGVLSASGDENTITISGAEKNFEAQKIHESLNKKLREVKAAKNAPITQMVQASAADELKKFKELLDMGVISQEEFDAKKKQLLGL